MDKLKLKIANRIKELRKSKNLTQEKLSFDIGSHSYISKLEMGLYAISIETVSKICKALNITIAEFFKDFK
ncbi:hypothetical protein FACS1894166_03190 [Bacilli bacterium]|nr:hypothetical protein FACS1894166_03190 [Bacilli bacterium]